MLGCGYLRRNKSGSLQTSFLKVSMQATFVFSRRYLSNFSGIQNSTQETKHWISYSLLRYMGLDYLRTFTIDLYGKCIGTYSSPMGYLPFISPHQCILQGSNILKHKSWAAQADWLCYLQFAWRRTQRSGGQIEKNVFVERTS